MSSFWISCLSQFENELPPQQFNTWIRPLRLEGEDDFANGLRLFAPNGFILKWVKERYLARIEELGSAYFSAPVCVALLLGERHAAPPAPPRAAPATGRGRALLGALPALGLVGGVGLLIAGLVVRVVLAGAVVVGVLVAAPATASTAAATRSVVAASEPRFSREPR